MKFVFCLLLQTLTLMFGIASETKMETICKVATKIKKFLLADDKSLAVRFSVESQTIHISRDSVSVKVNEPRLHTHTRTRSRTHTQIKQAESYTKTQNFKHFGRFFTHFATIPS